jgi:hypothetical protein
VPFSAEVQPPVIEPASSVEGAASDTTCIVQAPRAPRRAEPAPPADRFEGIEIHTGFGGIFYLINLAIYLGYYGDFSTPEEPGIDLPIWDFLAQTGRELAGQPLPEDPVWPLLTSLGEGEPWDRLEDAMRRIRDWLDEALGHHEGQREDTGAFVLRHSARVVLTGTRLDVFLSLQELPIEIRIARLDRDAGWVPAAGRYIAFHFL